MGQQQTNESVSFWLLNMFNKEFTMQNVQPIAPLLEAPAVTQQNAAKATARTECVKWLVQALGMHVTKTDPRPAAMIRKAVRLDSA